MAEDQRIAKLLARAGVASRREIERMIEARRIAIDGVAIETPATIVRSLHGVTVDGRPVSEPAPARLFLFNKPVGVLTAEGDPQGRATIYDRLPVDLPRVIPVGRLDINTEGLLLLTTDGGLKRQLELPSTGLLRSYRARAYGPVTQAQLEELSEGIEIEGVRYGSIDANMERRTGANQWIEMRLREGKNREVRRVLEHLGLSVSRLIRTSYGPFVLDDLPVGEVVEVRQHDLVAFRKDLKGEAAGTPRPVRLAQENGSATSERPVRPAKEDSVRPARVRAAPRTVEREASARVRPARAGAPRPVRAGAKDAAFEKRSGPARIARPARSDAAPGQPRTAGEEAARPARSGRGTARSARFALPDASPRPEGRPTRDGATRAPRPERFPAGARPSRAAPQDRPPRSDRDDAPGRARPVRAAAGSRPPRSISQDRPSRPDRDDAPRRARPEHAGPGARAVRGSPRDRLPPPDREDAPRRGRPERAAPGARPSRAFPQDRSPRPDRDDAPRRARPERAASGDRFPAQDRPARPGSRVPSGDGPRPVRDGARPPRAGARGDAPRGDRPAAGRRPGGSDKPGGAPRPPRPRRRT